MTANSLVGRVNSAHSWGEPLNSAAASISVMLELRDTNCDSGSRLFMLRSCQDDSLVTLPRALLDQLLVLVPASSPSPPLPLTMNTQ